MPTEGTYPPPGYDGKMTALRKRTLTGADLERVLARLADDIDAEFCGENLCSFAVSEFVRRWLETQIKDGLLP